ncbi:MAG: MFS transporter [Burkholderiales bacterium]|nr:MFS transporter [Burkholderiales bacterium]
MNPGADDRVLAPGVRAREAWAWAMFDFANSGYTTVVITAIYNAYFVAVIAGNSRWATLAWSGALAVSYLLVMLTGPAIGALADAYACKKKLLAATTVGCALFTAALALAGPGELAAALVFLVVSNFFFGSGENLIAAFLPEIADSRHIGRVSGWGWGLGYVGGMLTLGLCLAYVTHARAAGGGAEAFVPGTLWITAAMFLVASLPTFLFLRERARAQPHLLGAGALGESIARLARTWRESRRYRDLARFLACLVCYQAGVQAVVALAAIYAQQVMHFDTGQTIVLILVVNVAAAIGAAAFGYVQDRLGHKRAIALTLMGWLAMVVLASLATSSIMFWLAAQLAGLCLGSSQSAGRALVGFLSPPERQGEFYGLWGLGVKLSSILGPITYGAIVAITAGEHRIAFLVTGSYFLAGLALLAGVDVHRGREAALAGPSSKPAAASG